MNAMLHLIHKVSVSLFLLSYLLRLIGLLGGISAITNLFQKKVMRIIFDMGISSIFLITGIWMLMVIPGSVINSMIIFKIVMVFISIPLAVVGFKKSKKPLAILSVLLLIGAYGMAEMGKKRPVVKEMASSAVGGNELWVAGNCETCHGAGGANPVAALGAKNLSESKLSADEIKTILTKGKNSMPGYGKQFDQGQIDELVQYVKSFQKP